MQIARLFEIVYLLLERGCMTARELSGRFEVSTRTIYRDVETLSQAGIPVYMSKGRTGGIRLAEGFVLNKSVLTQEERRGILLGLQTLRAVPGAQQEAVLGRLGALLSRQRENGAGDEDWITVDLAGWDGGMSARQFNLLRQAVTERRAAAFDYFGANGSKSQRRVYPVRLHYKAKAWYLEAFCLLRGDWRLFKLCRIHAAALLDERYDPGTLPPREASKESPADVSKRLAFTLRVAPGAAFRVYEVFEEEQVSPQEDGSFLVHGCFPEDEWVYGYLLSYGPHAEVLEPAHLRETLRRKLLETYRLYSENMTDSCPLMCDTMESYKAPTEKSAHKREDNTMQTDMKFCQSCGMPLQAATDLGTNADGSKNEDYCTYCYQSGAFVGGDGVTMEEMIEQCVPHCIGGNPYPDAETARREMGAFFPNLKRWKKS